jgi:hypothetical protein
LMQRHSTSFLIYNCPWLLPWKQTKLLFGRSLLVAEYKIQGMYTLRLTVAV